MFLYNERLEKLVFFDNSADFFSSSAISQPPNRGFSVIKGPDVFFFSFFIGMIFQDRKLLICMFPKIHDALVCWLSFVVFDGVIKLLIRFETRQKSSRINCLPWL